jgi:hypothetical protein
LRAGDIGFNHERERRLMHFLAVAERTAVDGTSGFADVVRNAAENVARDVSSFAFAHWQFVDQRGVAARLAR